MNTEETPIRSFARAFNAFRDSFDPSALTDQEIQEAIVLLARVEKAAALMGAVAGALQATYRARGSRPLPMQVSQVARRSASLRGVTPSEALRALVTGRRLMAQPQVLRAALAGDLSMKQAALVTKAVQADPAGADFLVKSAENCTLGTLRNRCTDVLSAVGQGFGETTLAGALPAGSQERLGPRYLRSWLDRRGGWRLSARGTSEDGEVLMNALRLHMRLDGTPAATSVKSQDASLMALDALIALADPDGSLREQLRSARAGPCLFLREKSRRDTNDFGAQPGSTTFDTQQLPIRGLRLRGLRDIAWRIKPVGFEATWKRRLQGRAQHEEPP